MIKDALSSTAKLVLTLLTITILLVLNFYVWNKDYNQEKEVVSLQKELAVQSQENQSVAQANAQLKKRVESLKLGGGEMIEEEARSGFGMVGDGETFFYLEEASQ